MNKNCALNNKERNYERMRIRNINIRNLFIFQTREVRKMQWLQLVIRILCTSFSSFHSIFASRLAPKGSWGAANRLSMYTPDNLSIATSQTSGQGKLLKRVQLRRASDFAASPWYDNVRPGQCYPVSDGSQYLHRCF